MIYRYKAGIHALELQRQHHHAGARVQPQKEAEVVHELRPAPALRLAALPHQPAHIDSVLS